MTIDFCINKLDSFLPEIANQLGLEIKNNGFHIPSDHGKGYFCQFALNKDILVAYYTLLLNENTTIIRKKSENDNIIPIIFWLSDCGVQQEIDSEKKELGKNMPNGIFLPSNSTETKYMFPKGEMIRNITIFVTKAWLLENTIRQNNYLSNVILSSTNYFLFEQIDYEMSELIIEMENKLTHHNDHPLSKIHLYAHTLKLIYLFFDKIITRPTHKQLLNISPFDIQGIFKVKTILVNEYVSIPSISYLAKECGINQRKLQSLFKQVFGKSIYQFAISIRMNEAKKLLMTKKYNVSEVGYLVGYSNLSHFSEKFKEHFGMNPKSFLLSG